MSLILKNVVHNGEVCDIKINQCRFAQIAPNISPTPTDEIIDASGKAIFPGFYNLHTHAAMSLLKGVGDDKELFAWLSQDIWPREAKFDADIIYAGTKLAMLEMAKSGTVFFSDMYFEQAAIMKAAAEIGLRAAVSIVGFDMFDPAQTKQKIAAIEKFLELENPAPELIKKVLAIHSVYTVSSQLIEHTAKVARENNMMLHIHASETKKEVDDCIKEHGCSPIAYLEKLGGQTAFKFVSVKDVKTIPVLIPSFAEQSEIIQSLEAEQSVIDSCQKLIEVYRQKIKDKINEVWGSETK